MFIIEGLPAIAWAFVFRALAPTGPGCQVARGRRAGGDRGDLAAEQAGVPKVSGFREVRKSRNV